MNYARDELRAIDFVPKISSVYENVRTTFLESEQFDRMRKLLDPLRDDLAVFAVLTGLRHKSLFILGSIRFHLIAHGFTLIGVIRRTVCLLRSR